MNTEVLLSEIQKLSKAQKIVLLEQAWDDLANNPDDIPLPDWQKSELDKRLQEHYANPEENNIDASKAFKLLRQS